MLNFLKITKKERIILYVSIISMTLAFLDRLVYRPIKNKFAQLRDSILVEEKKIGRNVRNLIQKEAILGEYKKFSTYVRTFETDEKEMAALLKIIEETSRNSNIYITDIKPQPVINIDFYKKYIAELDAKAEMRQLFDFMHRLESLDQLINVEGLQLTNDKEGQRVIKARIVVTKILIP